jgi:hypothetical protein
VVQERCELPFVLFSKCLSGSESIDNTTDFESFVIFLGVSSVTDLPRIKSLLKHSDMTNDSKSVVCLFRQNPS